MYLEFQEFVKIPPNFDDFFGDFRGGMYECTKVRKFKIGKNELKHTYTITGIHIKGF